MKKIILFALLAISATMTMAQINPKSGIIITNSGDTIRGIIDFRTNETLSRECEFWAEGKTEGKTYKPGDIEGFRFDGNGKYFVTRKLDVDGKPRLYFAEFMVKGKMNLYCVADNPNEYFFFEREDGEMVKLTNKSFSPFNHSAQEFEDVLQTKKEQVGKVKYLLRDSWTAVEDMSQKSLLKENFSRKGLVNAVRDYHKDVCTDGSTCMVYEYDEKSDKPKCRFKVFTGYAYYSKEEPGLLRWRSEDEERGMSTISYSGSSFEIGIGVEMGIERIIKDASLEFGLIYSPKHKYVYNFESFGGQSFRTEYEYKGRLVLSIGLVKCFGRGKIVPLVRGGVIGVTDSETETAYKYSEMYTCSNTWACFPGAYLGVGAQVAVGKHFARLHADLYRDKDNTMTKWGITAEFGL